MLYVLYLLASLPAADGFFTTMSRMFMGKPKRPYTGVSRLYEALRSECALTPRCAAHPVGARQDCVLRCLSPTCWQHVYSEDSLEPGEIDDPARTRRYNQCLITQEGVLRGSPGLWPPQLRQSTGAVVEVLEEVDEFGAKGL